MSKVLFNRKPITIDIDFATAVGLNEAIVLQQIHYWIVKNKEEGRNLKEGRFWTYNSIEEWHKKIPFLKKDAVRKSLEKLRKLEILLVGNYNKSRVDRTLWYTINYEKLDEFMQVVEAQSIKKLISKDDGEPQMQSGDNTNANVKNHKCKDEENANANVKNHTPIPNNNKPIINKPNNQNNNTYIVEIVGYLNQVCGTNYKATTKKTQQLIAARLNEGFSVDEFKTVIDKQFKKWVGTEWQQYLRPNTLFNGDKFEGYLNAPISTGKSIEGHEISQEEDCPY